MEQNRNFRNRSIPTEQRFLTKYKGNSVEKKEIDFIVTLIRTIIYLYTKNVNFPPHLIPYTKIYPKGFKDLTVD